MGLELQRGDAEGSSRRTWFMSSDAPASGKTVVTVLAFICGDDNGGVVGAALNPFLHYAFAVCATIVTPGTQK